MENVIKKWIRTLINGGDLPLELIDESFEIEDGMNLQDYWEYEKLNFSTNSGIFDLDQDFKVEIKNRTKIGSDKEIILVYVINKLDKIVFKFNITINSDGKISSNNYHAHIVPKFVMQSQKISYVGLAIKSNLEVENIISPNFELRSFNKSSSFDDDGFYTAQFEIDPSIDTVNKAFIFYLKFVGVKQKEKRVVFFDEVKSKHCPYKISKINNTLSTKDNVYPVNVAVMFTDNSVKNFTYPRNFTVSLEGVASVIVTDVLDNDWVWLF